MVNSIKENKARMGPESEGMREGTMLDEGSRQAWSSHLKEF